MAGFVQQSRLTGKLTLAFHVSHITDRTVGGS